MRVVFFILLMALAWFVGWMMGSIHPAPAALTSPFERVTDPEVLEEVATDLLSELEPEAPVSNETEDQSEPEMPAAEEEASPPSPASEEAGLDQYRAWIGEARAKHPYPESTERMFAVMMCESGGQASVVNPAGPYTGLFQYAGGTWNGDWNTYRDDGITDARAQIFATALAWNLNMQSHWGCYGSTG